MFDLFLYPYISGLDSSLAELTDFICAAQMAKAADAQLGEFEFEEKVPLYFLVTFYLFTHTKFLWV